MLVGERLSDRLREMPEWVQDHVLVHELAHVVQQAGGHSGSMVRRAEAALARHEAMLRAPGLGAGHGPLDHGWPLRGRA